MTLQDLLKEFARTEEMPKVLYKGVTGDVVWIRRRGNGYEIGVNLGNPWIDWFHPGDSTDKRRKYLRDLDIINTSID